MNEGEFAVGAFAGCKQSCCFGAVVSAVDSADSTSFSSQRRLVSAREGPRLGRGILSGELVDPNLFEQKPLEASLEEPSLRFAGLRTAPADFTASLVMLQAVRIGQREWRKY